jgi:hypothetical protein
MRTWQDPWGQASEAFGRAMASPEIQALVREVRRLDLGGAPDTTSVHPAPAAAPETAALFNLWFRLVSTPEYVARVEAEMPNAWVGAQEALQRHASFQHFQNLAGRSTIRPWPAPLGD